MQRRRRFVGRWSALRAGIAGLAAAVLIAGTAGAQDDNGLVEDFAYESPTYGYEIAWDRPWEANEDDTYVEQGADVLSLETFGGFVNIIGMTTDTTPEEMVEFWTEDLPGDVIAEPEIVAEGADDDVAYAQIEDGDEDGELVVYVEARMFEEFEDEHGPLIIVSLMFMSEETFDNAAAAATADIEFDGDPLFLALGVDVDEDDDRRDHDEDDDEDEDRGGRDRDDEDEDDRDNDRDRDDDDRDDRDAADDEDDDEDADDADDDRDEDDENDDDRDEDDDA